MRNLRMFSLGVIFVAFAFLLGCGGNVTRAAEQAGVSRRFLQRMIARLGIKPAEVGATEGDFAGDGDE